MTLAIAELLAVFVLSLLSAATACASLPNKLVFTGRFGAEVNVTTGGDICTVASEDKCQAGTENSGPGGFAYQEGVAVGPPPASDVYVADTANERVQIFTSSGTFVSMFGWDVNETKSNEATATQSERDVCTAASGDKCKRGESTPSGSAGQIAVPMSIAVDQVNGNVYIWDSGNHRIEEYTSEGQFVLMIGGEVNKTKDKEGASEAARNLCTAASKDECQAGVESAKGAESQGAFKSESFHGNLLAVGGPQNRLYVGDEGRVQEFEVATGEWKSQILLTSLASEGTVKALAVDSSGDVYVVYNDGSGNGGYGIHEFNPSEVQIGEIDAGGNVYTFALDPFGRIAAIESEPTFHGVLFDTVSGKKLGEFDPPGGMSPTQGIAFNLNDKADGELYVADTVQQDVEMYVPKLVAMPVTGLCKSHAATAVTLTGEVNPENVNGTEAWFQYGTSNALGSETRPIQSIVTGNAFTSIEATLENLRPNQTYFYRTAAEDANYRPRENEEPLVGETLSCGTSYLAPQSEGELSSTDITYSSAVLLGALNPENANTEYFFEYGPNEALTKCPEVKRGSCPGVETSPALKSSAYGVLGVTQSINNLEPSTTYRYRLFAENTNAQQTEKLATIGAEGAFTTLPEPNPTAATGPVSNVAATSATLTGVVDPDGADATYSFQLGIYNGSGTVYTTIASGPTGAESGPVLESFMLTGLEPGTTYAYSLTIFSAYGASIGLPVTFTTAGLPAAITPPAPLEMLPIPKVAFPTEPRVLKKDICRHGYTRNKHGKCVRSKKTVKSKQRGKPRGRKVFPKKK